jgi:tryptophanyl-tRNA synthetase
MNYLSGFRPTGDLHLGNYLGAIKPALSLPNVTVFVANLHAKASQEDCSKTYDTLERFFPHVRYEAHDSSDILALAHELSFHVSTGLLSRMTQFKHKSKTETPTLNLFSYPVLMAADIFFYGADKVVVGIDQKQHVEFARDLHDIAKLKCPKPEAYVAGVKKVYDLRNPTVKMSKSNADKSGTIFLSDGKDTLVKKIRSAPAATNYEDDTAGANNLKALLREFGGNPAEHSGFGTLKAELTDRIFSELNP